MEDYTTGISQKKLNEIAKDFENDPMFEEFRFCKKCRKKALPLIAYIRKLEDAQIVAKAAIEALDHVNNKLTKERKGFVKKILDTKEKLDKKREMELKNKMKELDDAHRRKINKDRLV